MTTQLDLEELDDHRAVVRLSGKLDAPGVDRIDTRFTAALASRSRDTAVDLGGVDFLASLGLRMLITAIRAAQRHGRKVVLFGATPMVARVLEQSAFDKIAPIVADRDEALSLLVRPA